MLVNVRRILLMAFLLVLLDFSLVSAIWIQDGIPVAWYTNPSPSEHQITSDGAGGTIITWRDYRNGNYDIYAQRIDADGSIHTGWTIDGMPVCTDARHQHSPQIISDGGGGAIITWHDERGDSMDIYAQRIDADGGLHAGWASEGEPICTYAGEQVAPRITSDGAGGAIITWSDYRSGNYDIYAQRIDADGSIHTGWAADGEPICAHEDTRTRVIA